MNTNTLSARQIKLLIVAYVLLSAVNLLIYINTGHPWYVQIIPVLVQVGAMFIVANLGRELGAQPVQEELTQHIIERRKAEGAIQDLVNALLNGDNMVVLNEGWGLSINGQNTCTSTFGVSYNIPVGQGVVASRDNIEWDFAPQDGFVYVLASEADVRFIPPGNILLGIAPCFLSRTTDGFCLLMIKKADPAD